MLTAWLELAGGALRSLSALAMTVAAVLVYLSARICSATRSPLLHVAVHHQPDMRDVGAEGAAICAADHDGGAVVWDLSASRRAQRARMAAIAAASSRQSETGAGPLPQPTAVAAYILSGGLAMLPTPGGFYCSWVQLRISPWRWIGAMARGDWLFMGCRADPAVGHLAAVVSGVSRSGRQQPDAGADAVRHQIFLVDLHGLATILAICWASRTRGRSNRSGRVRCGDRLHGGCISAARRGEPNRCIFVVILAPLRCALPRISWCIRCSATDLHVRLDAGAVFHPAGIRCPRHSTGGVLGWLALGLLALAICADCRTIYAERPPPLDTVRTISARMRGRMTG